MTRETLEPFGAFYRTRPAPCPYLPDQLESRIFTALSAEGADVQYNALSHAGFRRSHKLAYRPACPACNACVPVRIVASAFAPNRTQRRVVRRNADLTDRECPARATAEQYRLFVAYLRARHGDGPMADMTMSDYRDMVEDSPIDTHIREFRDPSGALVAACLADRLSDGFSAVYSFSTPDEPARGLGNYVILRLVERARDTGLPYVYLGYWIEQSPKMAYKSRFRPMEALYGDGWRRMEEP
jgi:arginine-tRNA-protein transferase